ncbi:hypothetical protein Tco_0658943 [Tanacetum coccineum]
MVAFLEKSTGSAGFHQVIDFLNRSHICYALTKKPDVYISFIKQFWRSAEATTDDNGEVQITATIDGHSMSITEASLRRHLKLDDQDGITSIPNSEIFEQLALMGYHTDSDKLTFQKGAFSPQWRFLIHNILHCLSPKKTAWEQFSSNIATAIKEAVRKGSAEISTMLVHTKRRGEEQRTRQDKGKAIMIEFEPKKKSKKEIEQERLQEIEEIAKTVGEEKDKDYVREAKPPIFYNDDDDDDDESCIPLRDIISELPMSVAITPDLPITDSLIMEDEHLNTIPETKSDEENESSVKDLNLTPSEFEDLSDNESECDVPICDDSSPNFTTFSNPLFDSNDDFTSSDDESFSEEEVQKENFKIYSNPLFEFDEEIISNTLMVSSPKIDSLLGEFFGELAHINSIPPGIDEADFDPEDDIGLIPDAIIESFSLSPIPVEDSDSLMEEIDIFLAPDDSIPPGIENDDYDSEDDVLFLEELLNDDSISLPEYESFHIDFYNVPSSPRPPEKPLDDDVYFDIEPNTEVLTTKVVDDISDNSTRELYVHVPNVLPTLPTLYPVFDSLLPFQCRT